MLSPFVKELNECTHVSVSMGLFAFIALINTFLVVLLPETRGKDIPDTIDQIEGQNKQDKQMAKSSHMRQSVNSFIRSVYGDKNTTSPAANGTVAKSSHSSGEGKV